MTTPTIAFFGATGDCAGYALANSLNAGLDCIALARTPAKLTKSLKDKGVSSEALDQHLTVVPGNVKDVEAVKRALQLRGEVVDLIVSGIGSTAIRFQWSFMMPLVLADPTICQDAGNTILLALSQLQSTKKPILINVSTTGIQPAGKPRDVPIAYIALYHWLLASPHIDKREMERVQREHIRLPASERAISSFVNVKPSLLFGGESKGLQAVRQGIDERPAIGYYVNRIDVGSFIYERLIKDGVKEEWMGKSLSLTY